MGRKPTTFYVDVDAHIRAGMARGRTAQSIAQAIRGMGESISHSYVQKKMQEIRAGGPSTSTPPSASLAAPAPHPAPPAISGTPAPFTLEIELPESPDAIPAGTDQETLIAWIGKAQELGRVAQAKGDLDGFGKMGRLSASLLEAKRKGAPIPKADPNDRPDLIAAKEAARKRLHKLIDEVAA